MLPPNHPLWPMRAASPARFPENRQDLAALRIVIRNGMSRDLTDLLVGDLKTHLAFLEKLPAPLPQTRHQSFHH
jgi:glutamate decarboxylase